MASTLVFWFLGRSYLKHILLSETLFHNSTVDYSHVAGKLFVLLFAITNYLSFMMLLAFIPACVVLLIAFIAPYNRLVWSASILLSMLSIILLLIDTRVYEMFKFHLNWTIVSFVFNKQWMDVFDFSSYELTIFACVICAVLVLQFCQALLVWKKIIVANRYKIGQNIALCWLGATLFCYFTLLTTLALDNNLLTQQISNLPFFQQLFARVIPDKNTKNGLLQYSEAGFAQPIFSNDQLKYPTHAMQCVQPKHPFNIILIIVDSLRFDSLQLSYMPNVKRFGETSWQFLKHLSGGNGTQPGLFSLFYSIPASYWTAAVQQKISPVIINLLIEYGYTTQILWSTNMISPAFNKTVFNRYPHLNVRGAKGSDVGTKDRYVTQKAISFLTGPESKKPFFLNLFYDAPHGYCSEQRFPAPFQPTLNPCSRFVLSNDYNPKPYYNRYLNAVRFVDNEIAKVLAVIEEKGYLANSIIIVTADHGEEFNDNHQNYWGHASNFTDAQLHVPLIIHWPGELPRSVNYVTSSYDLVPTLLDRLFVCQNPVEDYSIGQNLLSETKRAPFLLVGSYANMGIVEDDRLTTLQASGQINITNKQVVPVALLKPRMDVIKQALVLMRKYYVKE